MKRIVVVGGGLIGIRQVKAVQAHHDCELVGLVDPDMRIDAGADVARFADMDDVPDGVDGAIIATPTGLHTAHGVTAAKRGWHVLIEKPVSDNVGGADVMQAALTQAGVQSLVGHHRRYHASVRQLRAMLAEGAIGTPVTATLIWAMRKPDTYFEGNWRTAGGSPVLINLVHDIDILRFVLGEIAEVVCLPGQSLRRDGRIESGAIALRLECGATATISFADTAPSPWGFEAGTGENPNIGTTGQDMMWITGSKGGISFPSMSLWQGVAWGQAAKRTPVDVAVNTAEPLHAQLDHFLEVMNGATPLIDVADATRTLAIALEIEAQLRARLGLLSGH
ncbi:Predicted dehydrogenase [Cognatiyoonia koreensis]|uniref:Predicted dehydrogenase n=1 Tax=Cognatiyoonia koreensis TaxID=364200 RepID=A0A1I0QXN6_9RHOB|nr:Predicted dehydrogenase [Cognatiyoonia koreensis]